MGQLDEKIAVITGAGSGIGRAIAERFAAEGAETILVGRRQERLDEVAKEIGDRARGVAVDVGDEEQVRLLMEGLPRIDILCTFAGSAVFGPVDELPPSAWRDLFHARFFGQLYAVHHAVPKMGAGSVILLCSGIADAAYVPHYAGGAAICGAVNAMGKNLAVELAERSIRVNVLSPGFIIGTDIQFNLEGQKAIDFVQRSIADTPLPYHGQPEDCADAALFLVTCNFATGQVIEVDGGWTAT
jgi:NAD(P)-dependent dehydrogenase (short-subunit alcohol dehydrogenase family)